MKKINKYTFLPFIIAVGIWQLAYSFEWIPNTLLPSPIGVGNVIVYFVAHKEFWQDVFITLSRVTLAYFFSSICGFLVGLLAGYYKSFNNIYTPLNNFIRYVPVASLIPMLIIVAGTGLSEKILVIFIGTFFQISILIRDDISSVEEGYIDTAKMLGIRKNLKIILRVIIPYRLPYILDILKVGFGWAWSYVLVAEIVGSSNGGLGFKLLQFQRFLKIKEICAYVILIGILGVVFDFAFSVLNKHLFKWRLMHAQ